MEELLLCDDVQKLHEIALPAKIHIERVTLLILNMRFVRKIVHRRMLAERKKPDKVFSFANPALRLVNKAHIIFCACRYVSHSSLKYSASASLHGLIVYRFDCMDSLAGNPSADLK